MSLNDYLPPESYVLYLCPGDSTSTISTNATAPNLPGPGRTIGLAYDALGSRLERRLRRFARPRNQLALLSPSVSSLRTSSTATQSNNPGTGRVIGLAYSALGRVLVKRLNRIACKVGLGPDAAGQNIEKWRLQVGEKHTERTGDAKYHDLEDMVLKKDMKKVKKLCKALMKYAQSDVISNQSNALALITELSIREPYIRKIFEELGVGVVLGTLYYKNRNYEDFAATLTMNNSRKALISISEVQISHLGNELWRISCHSLYTAEGGERACDLLRKLLRHGSDMNLTFLLFRLLVKLSWKLSSFLKLIRNHGRLLDDATSAISSCIEDVAGDGSTLEDWQDLDFLITSFLARWTFPRSTLACEHHQPYLRVILRFPDKLPSSVAYLKLVVENSWRRVVVPIEGRMLMFISWSLLPLPLNLRELANTDVPALRQTVCNSDNPLISDLLDTILCPPFLLLRQAILDVYPISSAKQGIQLSDYRPLNHEDIEKVPSSHQIEDLSRELITLCSSSHTKVRLYAVNCLLGLARSNRYFSKAIQRLTPQIRLEKPVRTMRKFNKSRKIIIYRKDNCHPDGSLILLTYWDTPVCSNLADQTLFPALEFHAADFMWLEIQPHMEFHAEGHSPIGAGMNVCGEQMYVAAVSSRRDMRILERSVRLCTVCEGDTIAIYYDRRGQRHVTDHFFVPVLRHGSVHSKVNLNLFGL